MIYFASHQVRNGICSRSPKDYSRVLEINCAVHTPAGSSLLQSSTSSGMVAKEDTSSQKATRGSAEVSKTITGSIWQTIWGFILIALNIAVRLYCAFYMIISDCDETFNYWEPLNLIARGFGKQTWEYSPAYAIRSYVYLIPYYVVTFPLRDFIHITGYDIPPYAFFYFVRVVALCGFTSFAEYKLFKSAQRNFSLYVANWFLLFSTTSAGMSHAGVALLPSSFAMGWVTLATASLLDVLTTDNSLACVKPSVSAITSYLVSGIVGWPFTLALGAPFGLFTMTWRYQTTPLIHIVLLCIIPFVFLIWLLIFVDSYIYERTMLFVPANIVLYNVFALEDEGPDIFGTEPFSYYLKNLFLNFNVVFILAVAGVIANPILFGKKLRTSIGISAPLVLWLFTFGSQPHKEERFLYPIYTLISLSAAVLTSNIYDEIKTRTSLRGTVRVLSLLLIASVSIVSLLRIVNLVENYNAPIESAKVFSRLSNGGSGDIKNVCIGREWYHFPTSAFLPNDYRLRFVRSGFDGLLPGDFPEQTSVIGAASAYPRGMNSKNIFSPDKVIDVNDCDFFIDNSAPADLAAGETQYVSISDGELIATPGWKIVDQQKIINPSGTHKGIGKLIYIPRILRSYLPYEVEYMHYCVLEKDA